jgi:hypothetical protein
MTMTDEIPTPAGGPAPDRPPVPRAGISGLAIAMAVIGGVIVAGYSAVAFADYEPFRPERDEIPASVRTSPGGYRSNHTWHTGYTGGK